MKRIFLILLLFPTPNVFGQLLNVRNYAKGDGLPSSQIWCGLQDAEGYIWFGTSSGLVKYNGQKFTTYDVADGLVSSVVLALLEDNGEIWIATDNGISRFHEGAFTNFVHHGGSEIGIVWCVTEFHGRLWFGTKMRGLLRIDPERAGDEDDALATFLQDADSDRSSVLSLAVDEDFLWIAKGNAGLFRYDGDDFLDFTKAFGLEGMMLTNLLLASDSTLWVGTAKHGVFKCDPTGMSAADVNSSRVSNHLPGDYIYSSAEKKGRILFGTRYNGVVDFRDGRPRYTTTNGLINNSIYSILIDNEESVWLGTNQGVSKILTDAYRGYLENETVTSVCEYAGAFWFGTFENGLFRLKDGQINRFSVKDGLLSNSQILALTVFRDKLWIGTSKGLNSYDGRAFKEHSPDTPGGSVGSILDLLATEDSLWIGTVNWVWRYQPGESTDEFTLFGEDSGLTTTYFQTICRDANNRIWFGAPGGAFYYDPDDPSEKMKRFPTSDGLSARCCVNAIFSDSDGTLWFGTPNGLNRYVPDREPPFESFALEDGLSDSHVLSITEGRGFLWLGTNRGLNKFDGQRVVKVYGEKEAAGDNSLYCDSRDHIWFCTFRGAGEYFDTPNTTCPPVRIETFVMNGSLIDARTDLEFGYDSRSTAEFSFTGLSFKDEDDVRFKHKMDGYDEAWSDITEKAEVRYTSLDSGRYVFKVCARTGDGYWSENPAEISFRIRPPYWKTWWFFSLAGIFAALVIRGGHRYRSRKTEREKLRLEELVREKTEMLNKLVVTDDLTKVYNRRHFFESLSREISKMTRTKDPDPLSLIILDVDHFKDFNDNYGHQAGDQILWRMAQLLKKTVRDTDTLARYGGEEFSIILPSTKLDGARNLAEKLRRSVEDFVFEFSDQTFAVTISLGVGVLRCPATFSQQLMDEMTRKLIRAADDAMYEAKDAGRNCVRFLEVEIS